MLIKRLTKCTIIRQAYHQYVKWCLIWSDLGRFGVSTVCLTWFSPLCCFVLRVRSCRCCFLLLLVLVFSCLVLYCPSHSLSPKHTVRLPLFCWSGGIYCGSKALVYDDWSISTDLFPFDLVDYLYSQIYFGISFCSTIRVTQICPRFLMTCCSM